MIDTPQFSDGTVGVAIKAALNGAIPKDYLSYTIVGRPLPGNGLHVYCVTNIDNKAPGRLVLLLSALKKELGMEEAVPFPELLRGLAVIIERNRV